MCVVCIEMAKGTLTRSEAKRALAEVALDPVQKEHAEEVFDSIRKEEQKDRAISSPKTSPSKK